MMSIKFSHDYPKLWGQHEAKLLLVRTLYAELLTKELVHYDTYYGKSEHYPLPEKGLVLQLIFLGDKGIPFCTIRRHTKEKESYYKVHEGLTFQIKIEED